MNYILPREFKQIIDEFNERENIHYDETFHITTYQRTLNNIIQTKYFKQVTTCIEKLWKLQVLNIKTTSPSTFTKLFGSRYRLLSIFKHLNFNNSELHENQLFDVIVTYEQPLNRIVIFQVKPVYNYDHSIEDKKELLIELFSKHKTYNDDLSPTLNLELTKLVILTYDIPTTELLKYLNTEHSDYSNGRGIELWKITSFEQDIITLEKTRNDFNENIDRTKYIKENDFFKYFKLTTKTINNYLLFKEYLTFNYNCRLETFSVFNRDILLDFYRETILEDWSDDYETNPIQLTTNEEVQSFLNDITNEYNERGLTHKGILGNLNYMDFSELRILLYTQGIEFNLLFVLRFNHNKINVTVNGFEGEEEWWINTKFLDFVITNKSDYKYFDKIMRTIHQKRIIIRNKRIRKKGNNINDLPF